MTRLPHALAVLAAAATVLYASASAGAAPAKLTGTVGPGFTITLKMGGKAVKSLKAGKYTITVLDRSNIHNFHLKGKGVNKDSGIVAVGTKRWTVTLKRGSYVFVCDPHATSMKGKFTVK